MTGHQSMYYQTLYVPELFRNTFGNSYRADLAALARTCKGFKEPALDLLWQKLNDLSPLVRCLPEASRLQSAYCHSFARPLSEAEQNILRSYARRVRAIHNTKKCLDHDVEASALRTIFNLAPLTDPLFPNLRSLDWPYSTEFPALHVAVPSLTSLCLDLQYPRRPSDMEFFNIFGDRCPNMKELIVRGSCVDVAISRQICCWPSLDWVHCPHVTLSSDAIRHLSSAPNLKQLFFMAGTDAIEAVSQIGTKLVFSSLVDLQIRSRSLDTTTLLLSHVQLPVAKRLATTFSNRVSKEALQAHWAAVREASPSIVSIRLDFTADGRYRDPPHLTLEDLLPCRTFSELRSLHVNLNWHVSLTDADLLHLASPRIEKITINNVSGWGMERGGGGGITLTGLVRLLRQCPLLHQLSLVINTSTFTEIPEGLDVSFPPRNGLFVDFADSYIEPEFVPGVVSVFTALKLDSSMFTAWEVCMSESDADAEDIYTWQCVWDKLRTQGSLCHS